MGAAAAERRREMERERAKMEESTPQPAQQKVNSAFHLLSL